MNARRAVIIACSALGAIVGSAIRDILPGVAHATALIALGGMIVMGGWITVTAWGGRG